MSSHDNSGGGGNSSNNTNTRMMTKKKRKKVCLFGTSADPPTGEVGHVGVCKALSKLNEFDEIRVLPVYCHQYSEKRDRLISFDHRMKMCELSFNGIPNVIVDHSEKICFKRKAKGLSPQEMDKVRVGTADLLDVLTEKEPMTDFSFALGTDTFMDLSSWKWRRSKDIFRFLQGRFLVLYRKQRRHQQESPNNHNATEITEEEVLERIRKVNQEYNHHWHHERKEDSDTDADTDADADAVGPTRLLRIPELSDVSSTQVRACTKVEDLEGLLVPEVLKYIVDNQLYGFSMQ
eukprot:CAMPEP_0202450844 /NCGR_PEP_ID=MMETSP1360-20130828/9391_1 /ASSEMBLY_ACC=CAM_ASM_000848 /TAXON_ID=515479 /ORGANISM="Licmophora paradoxa, Strain CCMP2313" /LENGTH=290 /DNA_ID=CAMNT_0049069253 /DNA_START=63 /DNA_END=935 /DNA_ORIENTATION=-